MILRLFLGCLLVALSSLLACGSDVPEPRPSIVFEPGKGDKPDPDTGPDEPDPDPGESMPIELELSLAPGSDGKPSEQKVDLRTLSSSMLISVLPNNHSDDHRLQLEARSEIFNRISITTSRPQLIVPVGDVGSNYEISLFNFSSQEIEVTVLFERKAQTVFGIRPIFNQPSCGSTCEQDRLIIDPSDSSNGMRQAIIDGILSARQSVDVAVYGFDDAELEEALCIIAKDKSVSFRMISDGKSFDPENQEGYFEGLLRLAECIEPFDKDPIDEIGFSRRGIEFVHNGAIMHHKFYIIDQGTEDELLITGSANQTFRGLNVNHNHMLFIRGGDRLMNAYSAEFTKLYTHCRGIVTKRGLSCDECSTSCSIDNNEEGPWIINDGEHGNLEAWVYFSPIPSSDIDNETNSHEDDALRQLRGPSKERSFRVSKNKNEFCVVEKSGPADTQTQTIHECRTASSDTDFQLAKTKEEVEDLMKARQMVADPACAADDANCLCRDTGTNISCHYCGGDTGQNFGIIGEATERLLFSVFAATDPCLGVAVKKVTQRNPEIESKAIFDRLLAQSSFSIDEYLCDANVEVFEGRWEEQDQDKGNPFTQSKNHNKMVVVDNTVFDGSMNLSNSGQYSNNENTLMVDSRALADVFDEYIQAEVRLLESVGVKACTQ